MAKVIGVECQKRGKVGNKIMQVINGMQIEKTMAIPSNPESAGQVAQRGVFADIIAGFKSIANSVLAVFWIKTVVGNQTPWGNFISKNLLSMGKVAFDITKAILCFGTLEPISSLSATYDTSDGETVITYSDDQFINGEPDDLVNVVVFDSSTGLVVYKELGVEDREAGPATITLPSGLTATNLELFAWCCPNNFLVDGIGDVSNSTNCTCTAPV